MIAFVHLGIAPNEPKTKESKTNSGLFNVTIASAYMYILT